MEPNEDQIRAACGYEVKPQEAVFYEGAIRDPKASEREGHNVYKPAVFVHIKAQGERDSISVPATSEHKMKFREQWNRFEAMREQTAPSPLHILPTITLAVVRTLNDLGIRTVEQLATAPVLERVELAEDRALAGMDHMADDSHIDIGERKLPCAVPAYLTKWQGIAKHFLTLKQYALTGEKPRIKLEAA